MGLRDLSMEQAAFVSTFSGARSRTVHVIDDTGPPASCRFAVHPEPPTT
ncbi:MAG TPA: hypothetical protein VGH85_22725 [Mycobacteriales bacterium]